MAFGTTLTPDSGAISTTSGSTLVIPSNGIALGRINVVVIAKDNSTNAAADNSEISSVTDVRGNTYVKAGERGQALAANAGSCVSIWYSVLTTALQSGDNITVNFSSSITAKCCGNFSATTAATSNAGVSVAGVVGSNGTTTIPSLSNSGLTSRQYMAVRGCAMETNASIGTGAATAGWAQVVNSNTTGGGAASNMSVFGEGIVSTATGYTSAPATSGTGDNANVIVALFENGNVGATLTNTNAAATGSPGTATPATDKALTGASATGSPGTLGAGQPATGVAATGASGTVGHSTAEPLTGLSATAAVGSLAPSVSGALSGHQAAGSAGTLTPPAGPAVWDSGFKSTGVTLSGSNLVATSSSTSWLQVLATVGKSSGKWYWEITATTLTDLLVGIATHSQSLALDAFIGGDANGAGHRNNGNIIYNGGFPSDGDGTPGYVQGNVIGVALDLDIGKVYWRDPSGWYGVTGVADDPAVPQGGLGIGAGTWYPAVSLHGNGDAVTANFGASTFNYTVPTGFTAIGGASSPDVTAALTGVAGTGQRGSLVAGPVAALTGQTGTGQRGTLGPTVSATLAGLFATAARGALSGGYPASVVAKSLQSVWDHANAGLSQTTTSTAGVDSLTAINASNSLSGTDITLYPGTYARWDFRGYRIFIDQSGTYSFTDCKFLMPTAATSSTFTAAVFIGLNVPTATPTCSFINCDLDGTSNSWNSRAIRDTSNGNITIYRCKVYNAAGTPIELAGTSATATRSITENWFRSPAMNPSGSIGDSHCENIALASGIATIANNLMECSDGTNAYTFVMTGAILVQGRDATANVVATIQNNIIIGFASIQSGTDIQAGQSGSVSTTKVYLYNNVMEPGTFSGAAAKYVTLDGYGSNCEFYAYGNIDYATSAPILDIYASPPLSGLVGTSGLGAVQPTTLPAFSGVAAIGSPGSVATSRTVGLSGLAGTGAVGSVVATIPRSLTGLAVSGAAGTVGPVLAFTPAGLAASGVLGALAMAPRVFALTGSSGAGAIGLEAPSTAAALTGTPSIGLIGSLSVPGGASLAGVAATGSAGALTASPAATGSGVQGAAQIGGAGAQLVVGLAGVSAAVAAGSVGLVRAIAAAGLPATGIVGAAAGRLDTPLAGAEIIAFPGTLRPSGGLPITVPDSQTVAVAPVSRTVTVHGHDRVITVRR